MAAGGRQSRGVPEPQREEGDREAVDEDALFRFTMVRQIKICNKKSRGDLGIFNVLQTIIWKDDL